MSLIALLIYIVIVALIGYVAVWALGMLAPGHPAILDGIVWIVVVLIILIVLAQALGVTGPAVPRLR